jgi:proteasome lid subunit RPN8/RPN11
MQKAHGKMKQGDRLIPHIIFTDDVLRAISRTVGRLPAESGGPFGGYENSRVVTHFHFDQSGRTSGVTYSPDAKRLNRLFKSQWNAQGIRLFGFIHSHPGRMNCPSGGDLAYAERILGPSRISTP